MSPMDIILVLAVVAVILLILELIAESRQQTYTTPIYTENFLKAFRETRQRELEELEEEKAS